MTRVNLRSETYNMRWSELPLRNPYEFKRSIRSGFANLRNQSSSTNAASSSRGVRFGHCTFSKLITYDGACGCISSARLNLISSKQTVFKMIHTRRTLFGLATHVLILELPLKMLIMRSLSRCISYFGHHFGLSVDMM